MKKILAAISALMMVLLAVSPAGAQDEEARIHLIHGIPGVDVDVEVDGDNVFEGFAFQDVQDISSFAGATLAGLTVKVAGTDDVAIDAGDVTLPAAGNYTIIAHLDAEGTPTLGVFENDISEIAAGEGRITVRHTAAAPDVDVLANGEVALPGITNGAEAGADLPAGTISAEVVPAGASEPVVIGPADLPITEGSSLIVYAVGSLEGETLTVLTESIDGLGGTPTVVNTGTSPVETSGSSVAVWALVALAGVAVVGGTVGRRMVTVKS